MKNKSAIIFGFILGFAGFLLLFKILFLPKIDPSDELAPGVILLMAATVGGIFAFIGNKLQKKSA